MIFMVHDSLTMMAQSGHIHGDKRIFNMLKIPICAIIAFRSLGTIKEEDTKSEIDEEMLRRPNVQSGILDLILCILFRL